MTRPAPLLLLLAYSAGACQQATGVHLTVRGPGLTVDQLQVSATWSGKTVTHVVPATPSATQLSLPTDLFAQFDAQSVAVDLVVDASSGGVRIASGVVTAVAIEPHHITDAAVDLHGVVDSSSYTQAVLADQPIAYYRLDDVNGTTALDSSGHGQHGTYGPTVMRSVAGLVGDGDSAAGFIGGGFTSKAIVTVPSSVQLQPGGSVSVEVWLRPSAPNDKATLVEYGDGPVSLSPSFGANLQGGLLGGFLATSQSQTGISGFRSTTAPAPSHSYHCVETYDGQSVRIYVDGALQGTQPASGTLWYTAGQSGLGIGGLGDGDPSNGDVVFAGTLDEVALYATALAPDRVKAHFDAATPH